MDNEKKGDIGDVGEVGEAGDRGTNSLEAAAPAEEKKTPAPQANPLVTHNTGS
jgi:hypothetical protein